MKFRYLLIITLIITAFTASSLTHASDERSRENDSEIGRGQVLNFPPGLYVTEEIREASPDWVTFNPDGTLTEVVLLPQDVLIPDVLSIPERMVLIPFEEQGEIIWKEYLAPAVEIDLASALDYSNHPTLLSFYYTSYSASVQGALWGHCESNGNYARFNVSFMARNFVGQSSLPTWTPTHGSVQTWDFTQYGPGATNTVLCIPKSIYWTYIGPFAASNQWVAYYLQLAAYNNPSNWQMSYTY